MTMHAALLAECLDEFAGGDVPRVLLGDFNTKPEDHAYRLLTTGQIDADVQARIQQQLFPGWKPKLLSPLHSAYCLAHGVQGAAGEPACVSASVSECVCVRESARERVRVRA